MTANQRLLPTARRGQRRPWTVHRCGRAATFDKMKKKFIFGIIVSVIVANATIVIKMAASKYPGIGDFWIYWVASNVLFCSGAVFMFIGKSILAVLTFSALYFLFRRTTEALRISIALATTTIVQILLSCGVVVLA